MKTMCEHVEKTCPGPLTEFMRFGGVLGALALAGFLGGSCKVLLKVWASQRAFGRSWVGLGSVLDRSWVGPGSVLSRSWVGLGSVLWDLGQGFGEG